MLTGRSSIRSDLHPEPILRLLILPLLMAVFIGLAVPAAARGEPHAAQASNWAETDHGAVRLISTVTGVGSGGGVTLGLQFRMHDGWKIYWRSPGDAGYPPQVDWSSSGNVADAAIHWPAPERFSVLGFETIGYKHAVVLPIDVRLKNPGEPLLLRAHVDYLTCDDICVPYTADLALDVPSGPAAPSGFAEIVGQAIGAVPTVSGGGPLQIESIEAVEGGKESQLRIVVQAAHDAGSLDVFVEGPTDWAFGAPMRTVSAATRRTTFVLPAYRLDKGSAPLPGSDLTVTVVEGDRAIEQRLTVASAEQEGYAERSLNGTLLAILAIALLGGVILNLMPCVLPVLSIKLLSLVSHGGGSTRVVRLGFAATAAGIVVSFLLLALIMWLLTAAGAAVGWGLQFQSPWFLIIMTLVVVLFASNLWGAFEVPLPRSIANVGARIGHAGGLGGPFLTGILATLLATPCSAPFVGTALGYALSRGGLEIFTVFLAMGVGLALPYILVASFPALVTRLPRPGPWMVWVKRLLGLALFGTGVWLLVVLSALIGQSAAAGTAIAVVLAVALLFFRKYAAHSWRAMASLAIVLLGLGAFVPLSIATDVARTSEDHWLPFSEARISELVAEGQVVYVNVTADWCLTCKVNENLVLNSAPVQEKLASSSIVAMRGDWTRADAGIARYLASFGRYGIPFDAVYGPGRPEGKALPELLSVNLVLDAISEAREPVTERDHVSVKSQ
ncbi:MAG: thioredoxin family protein [Hyphomicrobiales bacterium]|nr:thioredoxin family protein [Hyphomicrobiales bacterium]